LWTRIASSSQNLSRNLNSMPTIRRLHGVVGYTSRFGTLTDDSPRGTRVWKACVLFTVSTASDAA
jgi:hypothetical protein